MNWSESELRIYNLALKNVENNNKQLARIYLTVQKDISDKLKSFYAQVSPSWSQQYQAQRISELFTTINQRLSQLTQLSTAQIKTAYLDQYQEVFNNYAYDLSDYYSGRAFFGSQFAILPFSTVSESVIMASLTDKVGEYSFLKSQAEKQITLRQDLREILTTGIIKGQNPIKVAKDLEKAFDSGLMRYVATARTEMLKAYSLAQEESVSQAQEMGIEFTFQWLGRNDGRERLSHIMVNNTFAKIVDDKPVFYVGKSKGSGPRLLEGPDQAAQNIQCRCRRLNIPFNLTDVQKNNFPTLDDRPDFKKFAELYLR